MPNQLPYRFSSFRLDPQTWRLRKNDELRPLRPKTFAILRYLLDNAGRLVTKEDLFAAVWPGVKVENSALRVCMNELRQALEDDPHRPRFVETVHRLGYRFIAPVTAVDDDGGAEPERAAPLPVVVVGRQKETSTLLECWERAMGGTRQVVFVVGEPGIGKTTLMDRLLDSPQVSGFAYRARGQCVDQYGEGEAYFPIFGALDEICRGPHGQEAGEALKRHAPDWAAQIPSLMDGDAPNSAEAKARPTSSQMLAEVAAALSAITAIRPILLVCEDLHLGDRPTLELITYLAKRRDSAPLMIVGTYRSTLPRRDGVWPAGMMRDLRANAQCKTLRLTGLKEQEVAEYLDRRMERTAPSALVGHVHRRTGGNPLFMNAIVDHLESLGRTSRALPDDLRDLGVPDNIHAMIEQQIDDLPEKDQKLLKLAGVAAVQGFEFSSAALAAALEDQPGSQDEIEEQCERLVRRVSFLRSGDVTRWPDGTVSASYAFGHALYQEVLYGLLSVGQRARAHLRIAQRLKRAWGAQAGRVATELAIHFERGGDFRLAAEHINDAADVMISRGAASQALRQTERGLELIKKAPNENDRARAELRLETTREVALVSTGAPAAEIKASVDRLTRLVSEVGPWAIHLLVIQGITRLNLSPTENRAAIGMIKAGLRQAQKGSRESAAEAGLLPLQSIAHMALAIACNRQGEFREAASHAEKAIATYDPAYQPPSIDSRVFAISEDANSQWHLGFPDKARARALEAIDLADQMSHAPALVYALARGATVFGLCRDLERALALVDRLITFAADKDLPTMRAWGYFLRGAYRSITVSADEGCRIMRSAIAELDSPAERARAGGTAHPRALLCFCEVEAGVLRPHEAIARLNGIVEESLQTGAEGYLSDIYRMMGVIRLGEGETDPKKLFEVEKLFQKGLDAAQVQGDRAYQLRVALDLARLWQRQGKAPQARKMLASIYRRFTEGHDTQDLKDAKALIAELGSQSSL